MVRDSYVDVDGWECKSCGRFEADEFGEEGSI